MQILQIQFKGDFNSFQEIIEIVVYYYRNIFSRYNTLIYLKKNYYQLQNLKDKSKRQISRVKNFEIAPRNDIFQGLKT